jgi:hypothetical protein
MSFRRARRGRRAADVLAPLRRGQTLEREQDPQRQSILQGYGEGQRRIATPSGIKLRVHPAQRGI